MTTKAIALLTAVSLFSVSINAGVSRRENFLSSGPGGAPLALGDAVVAWGGGGAGATYYNPATLTGQYSNVFMEYNKLNTNATRSWAAIATGDPLFKIGLAWKHEGLPLSSRRDAVMVGVGVDQVLMRMVPLPQGTSAGVTVGYLDQQIADHGASAYFVDTGLAWKGQAGRWKLGAGAVLKNLLFSGLEFSDGGEKEIFPRELRLGISAMRWKTMLLMGVTNVDSEMYPALGLEYSPMTFLHFRAGMNGDPRMGIGFDVRDFRVDISHKLGEISGTSSLAVSYVWGKPKEVDYSDPLSDIEARHRSLEALHLEGVRSKVQNLEMIDLPEVLRLLAVAPDSDDAWSLIQSLSGEARVKASIPKSRRARRDYLSFAVAYAEQQDNASEYAQAFIRKYKGSRAARLIQFILKLDEKHSSAGAAATEEKK